MTQAWYAVWTHSHCERLVAQQLAGKGFSPFLPEVNVWSSRNGQPKLARQPMFPGYLFIRQAMEKQSYIEMLKVRGIVRILEDGWTRLTPVPDDQINAIQTIAQADVPIFPHSHLREGSRVRIVDGPLEGLEGIFVQDKRQKGRLVVSVDLLGRSVAVEVDGTKVRPN